MFNTWLEETAKLQREAFGHTLPKPIGPELSEWMRTNVLAAEDELHEALAEVSWKPWASAEFLNREAFIGEMVDCLHFIGNLLAGVGCTDKELSEAYREKMSRNRARQKQGYTGTSKCMGCSRALDDIQVHGGTYRTTNESEDGFDWICNTCEEGVL